MNEGASLATGDPGPTPGPTPGTAQIAQQVKVHFTTTEADLELPESKRHLLVPSDIQRYGLSRILNSASMLDTQTPVPLDFLVHGAFLRSSLADYLAAAGLSGEAAVSLQYVRSLLPPSFHASFSHNDWVSAVDASSTLPACLRLLTASYDGLVRVWDASGTVLATSLPAAAPRRLNCARFLTDSIVVAAGLDQTLVVWDYSEPNDPSLDPPAHLTTSLELYGHRKMVASLDVQPAARRILSAAADGCVALWSASKRSAPPADPDVLSAVSLAHSQVAKRLKTSSSSSSSSSPPQRGPLSLLAVHSDAATGAIFHPNDPTVAYSVSHDCTLRTLDLTTCRTVSTVSTLHPLLCCTAVRPASSAPLVAAGTSARHVTLLDPRESTTTPAAMTLRGHTNMVAAVAADPESEHGLVSASHDGDCRVWDLRSVRPARPDEGTAAGPVCEAVYVIGRQWLGGKRAPVAGQGVKVLAVAWDREWGIVSAGEDKSVQINKASGEVIKS